MKNKLKRNDSSEDEPVSQSIKSQAVAPVSNKRLKTQKTPYQTHLNLRNRNDKYSLTGDCVTDVDYLGHFNLIPEVNVKRKKTTPAQSTVVVDDVEDNVDHLMDDNIHTNDEKPSKIDHLLSRPTVVDHVPPVRHKRPGQRSNRSYLYEHVTKLGSKTVPVDAFPHLRLASSPIKSVKYELVYGAGRFYWPVKVKKFNSFLYQIKMINTSDATDESVKSCLFHADERLLRLVMGHLRPVGSSRNDTQQLLKQPDDLFPDFIQHLVSDQVQLSDADVVERNLEELHRLENGHFNEGKTCEMTDGRVGVIRRNVNGRILVELDKPVWLYVTDAALKVNRVPAGEMPASRQYFRVDYMLECLYENRFYVGRVVEAPDEHVYFRVELDAAEVAVNGKQLTFYYSSPFHTLFPCKWCSQNNLALVGDSSNPDAFDWDEYMARNASRQMSRSNEVNTLFNWSRGLAQLVDKFQLGMYLECVDPRDESVICLARINAKVGHLIFLKIFNDDADGQLYVYPVDSTRLFPLGWCEMNNYYNGPESDALYYKYFLKPIYSELNLNSLASLSLSSSSMSTIDDEIKSIRTNLQYMSHLKRENWCDRIYLNTSFNCGPYFMQTKLETLPKQFGPGPIFLVVHRLLQMLINISEKPFKLVKLFQASRYMINRGNTAAASTSTSSSGASSAPSQATSQVSSTTTTATSTGSSSSSVNKSSSMSANLLRCRVKVKEKGKYLLKDLELCTNIYQLNEFLNDVCVKLKACSRMLSLVATPPPPHVTNQRYCVQFRCCELCSLNYSSTFNVQVGDEETNINSNKSPDAALKPKDDDAQVKLNKAAKAAAASSHLKKTTFTYTSPVKTRFNLRQNLYNPYNGQYMQRAANLKAYFPVEKIKSNLKKTSKSLLNQTVDALDKRIGVKASAKKLNKKPPISKATENVADKGSAQTVPCVSKKQPSNTKNSTVPSRVVLNGHSTSAEVNKSPKDERLKSPVNNSTADSVANVNTNGNHVNNLNGVKNGRLSNGNTSSEPKPNSNNGLSQNGICTNPIKWSSQDVCKYLLENKFDSHLIYLIQEHEIDGQSFLMLNLPTIQNYMNLKLGPAIKLAHLVDKLKLIYFREFNPSNDDDQDHDGTIVNRRSL